MNKQILIIGSGLAGLSAAIQCASEGKKVVLISQQPSWCSQSVLAAGGINAVLDYNDEEDSVTLHAEDTFRSGGQLADFEAVKNLTEHAPDVIHFLEECGVVFSRDDKGHIAQRYFGGQNKKRTCFSKSNIGKQLVTGLEQRLRYYIHLGLIDTMNHHSFISLICHDNDAKGVVIFDEHSKKTISLYGPVIIASGGMRSLFGNTTGSLHSDGSVTASLYMSGLHMANLEMIQYHPTTIKTPTKNMLISEAARGDGGRLFAYKNGKRWYFCEEWFDRGNLMPRDVISRAIYRVIHGDEADKTDTVWLDISFLGEQKINERLLEIRSLCLDYLHLDPVNEPIPVVPAIHYYMGGLWVDLTHRTSMSHVYAAGECCYQYHGANRLGGNSTLGAIFGGQTAAHSACEDLSTYSNATPHTDTTILHENKIDSSLRLSLQSIMSSTMGIIRDENELQAGLTKLKQLCADSFSSDIQTYNLAKLGEAMILSALQRKESRGAHYRSDYPDTLSEWAKPTIIHYIEGKGCHDFC